MKKRVFVLNLPIGFSDSYWEFCGSNTGLDSEVKISIHSPGHSVVNLSLLHSGGLVGGWKVVGQEKTVFDENAEIGSVLMTKSPPSAVVPGARVTIFLKTSSDLIIQNQFCKAVLPAGKYRSEGNVLEKKEGVLSLFEWKSRWKPVILVKNLVDPKAEDVFFNQRQIVCRYYIHPRLIALLEKHSQNNNSISYLIDFINSTFGISLTEENINSWDGKEIIDISCSGDTHKKIGGYFDRDGTGLFVIWGERGIKGNLPLN